MVRFTTIFTNSGQVPYTGITIASNITDVRDDATPNGDQTATSGTRDADRDRDLLDREHPGRRHRHDHRHA